MKTYYQETFKKYFHEQLLQTRNKLDITQSKMAKFLMIEPRSYTAIEIREHGCSAFVFVMFLLYCCKDPMQFLEELRKRFEKLSESIA